MTWWEVLGLEPEADTRSIKGRYAQLLRNHRPDEDPEGFQRLREAYEAGLHNLERPCRPLFTEPVTSEASADSPELEPARAHLGEWEASSGLLGLSTEELDRLAERTLEELCTCLGERGAKAFLKQRLDAALKQSWLQQTLARKRGTAQAAGGNGSAAQSLAAGACAKRQAGGCGYCPCLGSALLEALPPCSAACRAGRPGRWGWESAWWA